MNPQKPILIIDDEPDIRELLELTLMRMGYHTHSADSLASAFRLLDSQHFALCLTDMKLPDGSGLDIIRNLQERPEETPVAVITAFGSVDLATESLKAGAFDFISKPIDLDRLRNLVRNAVSLDDKPAADSVGDDTRQLIGETDNMVALRRQIAKLSRSQAPVYISGESGSGKEVVARLIHASGPRADAPFVPVNCGAIPSELMESEFFGHVKGSFTGAHNDKAGLFESADGGTLFLDEIADLPLNMQVKLLRAIQNKSVRPVGANREIPVDVRLLSATHKDLATQVEKGHFRTDLFYRINVIEVKVPSLRERVEDIPLLANAILNRLSAEWGMKTPQLDASAQTALSSYPFPGNVRELENILERAVTLCDDDTITAGDLQLPDTGTTPSTNPAKGIEAAFGDLEGYLQDIERAAIEAALAKSHGNKTEAAELLGLSFRQFRYRAKKILED
ncbi:two-component system response regulator PilR (NtrC family) [Litorivivens lipolytica]|uniref:Two-component system response regulator PilR (NtrC family) n=1 Tax=Litorivivens lipolytica TaxID=1524264 RepID=A0A7W4W7E7_9GAMM|nr:sigma-54 dependent transcriptional regulator [Litorivivens lipolytica]MBB3048846.1 two-component system response regulator PilR (NtrC family) [Litorivivens lipolytica]